MDKINEIDKKIIELNKKYLKELKKLKEQKTKLTQKTSKEIKLGNVRLKQNINPDKNEFIIKKEQLRIKRKYNKDYVQLLDDKGRIIEETQKEKELTIKEYLDKFRKDGTLKKGLKRVRLSKVTEYNDSDTTLKNLKDKEKFQYAFSVVYKGKVITARSTQFNKSKSNIEFAKKHALNNLQRKLSYLYNGVSDSTVGAKLIKDKKIKIKKSVIYYRKV